MILLYEPWREIERREKRAEVLRRTINAIYWLSGFVVGLAVGKLLL